MRDERNVWSVDRSWSNLNYQANLDGTLYPSRRTKLHLDSGDTTALCSNRILLNSTPGDHSAGRVFEIDADMLCKRCVRLPKSGGSES